MATYFDTSALVKILVDEEDSEALRAYTRTVEHPVSSDLTRTELVRAVRRVALTHVGPAMAVLDSLTLLAADAAVFRSAALLEPVTVRSLDAVHLASALLLGDDLDAFVTYDDRLAEAARRHGLAVVTPRDEPLT